MRFKSCLIPLAAIIAITSAVEASAAGDDPAAEGHLQRRRARHGGRLHGLGRE